MKTNNKGFSLVELIVVIAIMAILAAVAIPTFATFIKKANVASDESYMNDIAYAIELALANEGGIPEGGEIRVTITGTTFSYEVVDGEGDAVTLSSTDIADIAAMLDSTYSAKGLDAGTYHKDGENWENCNCGS